VDQRHIQTDNRWTVAYSKRNVVRSLKTEAGLSLCIREILAT